jgi:membrane associated rhomboid family serine protease
MLSERDYMQPQPGRRWWSFSATIVLVALNILAFCFQRAVLEKGELIDPKYLELSLWGMVHGYVWQLLTYQFMHGSWVHLLLNCWALFVFGRAVEWAIGKSWFLAVYFTSGIMGGLVQVLACLFWPQYFNPYGGTVGASAGVFGVVASFAMLFPDQQLIMLLFFVIPMKLRARSLLALLLVLTGLGIGFPKSRLALILGANVAHFAHLGGILTGMAFCRFYFFRKLHPPPASEPI